MKTEVRSQKSEVGSRRIFLFCLLSAVCCLLSCSIPNLESPACTDGREDVRQFYSFHLGNDMHFSKENLRLREKFISSRLLQTLSTFEDSAKDYFTATDDYPKAFRVGSCDPVHSDQLNFEVLLFWRDDNRSEERKIFVNVIPENGKWVIDKVSEEK